MMKFYENVSKEHNGIDKYESLSGHDGKYYTRDLLKNYRKKTLSERLLAKAMLIWVEKYRNK